MKRKLTTYGIIIVLTIVIAVVGLASYKSPAIYPDNYIINIQDKHANHFVTENYIKDLIQEIGVNNPGIMRMENINLKRLEDALKNTDFIRHAQVSRDLRGNLIVDIIQDTPMARIISAKGEQGYVSQDKSILPLSDNFTSRVLVLTGTGADSLFSESFFEKLEGKDLYKFIDYINETPFWKSQIAQVDLDHKMNMTIYPQVGKQKIEFGKAENFPVKLKKLQVYYDQIAPNKGWNTHKVVKLQYKGQIVVD